MSGPLQAGPPRRASEYEVNCRTPACPARHDVDYPADPVGDEVELRMSRFEGVEP